MLNIKFTICILGIILCATNSVNAEPTSSSPAAVPELPLLQITVPKAEEYAQYQAKYFYSLLELALQKTQASDGPFQINQARDNHTSSRLLAELMRDNPSINVVWTSNSKQRQDTLLPIKISILHGLNSYRAFLIRKEDQQKFAQVHSLKDLSQYKAGQGAQWPDTSVMLENGLPVMATAQADLLFDMLAAKRFDYFPRGLHETWYEQAANAYKGLVVEQTLLLHYPSPMYFFVNKKETALANRIERGLRIAMQDGSFDALFFSIPSFKHGFEELHQSNRLVLNLNSDFQDQD